MAAAAGLWLSLVRLAPRLPGSDRDLLARFAAARDEPAFNELLRRHGGLVWSVCRRHLRDPADAEDAFQATFVVLASKPHAVRRAESLGAWLHGTAWRVASRLRETRRRTQPEVETAAPPDDPSLRDALAALDEELVRLPARFRDPLTACYLLDRTQDEAAGDLGLSVSTVKRRLTTGRELLRERLQRRGVELGAVLAVLALRSPDAPAALLQTTLSTATLGVASASVSPLVQGVLAMMWQAKLKAWAAGLGLAAATLGGTGYLASSGLGQGPPAPGPGTAKAEKPMQGAAKPEPVPTGRGDPETIELLQFEIDRAKLQIQRADLVIEHEQAALKMGRNLGNIDVSNASVAALQAKEDKLVAELALKRAERKLAVLKISVDPKVRNQANFLQKSREERLEHVRQGWKVFSEDVLVRVANLNRANLPESILAKEKQEAGNLYFPAAMKLSALLLDAELGMATTADQQAGAWNEHFRRILAIRNAMADKLAPWALVELHDAELLNDVRRLEIGLAEMQKISVK